MLGIMVVACDDGVGWDRLHIAKWQMANLLNWSESMTFLRWCKINGEVIGVRTSVRSC